MNTVNKNIFWKAILIATAAGLVGSTMTSCGETVESSHVNDVSGTQLVVNVYNDVWDTWPENMRNAVTYCVSKDFGANYTKVVNSLRVALDDWETYGGFHYTHKSEFDGNCSASTAVTFDVRPVSGQDYLMRAFFPHTPRAQSNILVDSSTFSHPDQAQVGFFRHEVGHTLGFRHEHLEVTGCNEDGQWQRVTTYDAASVMHYPHCKGGTGDIDNLILTERDRNGIAKIYPKYVGPKVYFFKGGQYSKYDMQADRNMPGYPTTILPNWRGITFSSVDAAVNWGNGKVYFFSGSQYLRYDVMEDRTDPGYPTTIAGNWPGVTFDRIDAAINWGNGKVYLFSGSQYIRYDIASDRADAGYPRPIAGNWPGLFNSVDAAFNTGSGKVYFFRGSEYSRYDIATDQVDPGYPQPIAQNWPGLFAADIDAALEW
ncbi:MAG TPA: hemopexin repeat-containing protein [Oligoflexus sp.]|uniref:hemopexin repeat-containing protein n=1 Tax=Oligoflexus sp. TaxID=1971216 RepID=UPI002D5D0477|nr:hemopexin repeat-containing protein [Oligoflexus sp.]HYX37229.1 hemopexin repeat-containing protein [Oligoflexus sp.]